MTIKIATLSRNFYFDTSTVEDIIQKVISIGIDTTMVVKSTILAGFVNLMKEKYNIDK